MAEQLPLFSTPLPDLTSPADRDAVAGPALGPGVSLTAAILAWRQHLERERTPLNTIKAFVGDLNLAAQFVGAFRNVSQVSTRDLDNWLQWERGHKQCSPKTYARRVTSLKSFFRWLHASHVVPSDPAAALIQQTVLSPLPEILSDAEVGAAAAAAEVMWRGPGNNPTPYVLFTLLIQTGIKKGECLNLEPNHVDRTNPAQPVLWVRHNDPRHRYKERKLALDPAWLPAYDAYLAFRADFVQRRRLGPRARKLFVWSPRRLEYWLADLSTGARLDKQISFDMCRWTCAVRDVRAGLDDTHLRQKLGLSKIQWREIGMKLGKLTAPVL